MLYFILVAHFSQTVQILSVFLMVLVKNFNTSIPVQAFIVLRIIGKYKIAKLIIIQFLLVSLNQISVAFSVHKSNLLQPVQHILNSALIPKCGLNFVHITRGDRCYRSHKMFYVTIRFKFNLVETMFKEVLQLAKVVMNFKQLVDDFCVL